MEWLVGFASLWVLFQWIIPVALLVLVAVAAMRWARSRNQPETPTFTSALPEDRIERERPWPADTSEGDVPPHLPRPRE